MTEQTSQIDRAEWALHLDRFYRVMIGKLTGGLAPSTVTLAFIDWAMHLATSPGRQILLSEEAAKAALKFASTSGPARDSNASIHDPRFQSDGWNAYPFSLYRDIFLEHEQWWLRAVSGVRGVSKNHEDALSFATRQFLDVFSPTNSPFLNPDIVKKTNETFGSNFIRGSENALHEIIDHSKGGDATVDSLRLGEDLATTPGKIVARTHLMELIQYTPTTKEVRPEPILIVPAWIMKYYILDLSPHNSFVHYLLDQGFTVFMISWRNPSADDRDLTMEDYLTQGPKAALDAIETITNTKKTHAIGYCLGGTLLSITASALARDGDDRLATLTLLAAQTDFSEAGELKLFISEAQVTLLEDMMKERGYLDSSQMLGAFTMLRSNDLLWSRLIHEFYMGEKPAANDLMAWNADSTRMPAQMHADYLRDLYLDNKLAYGQYRVGKQKISLTDLRLPILAVGTESDHVAPWKSVFKIHQLTESETTFILTNGGHNAGILSEPGHPHRHHRISTRRHDQNFIDADTWFNTTEPQEGSWWPSLASWLALHSSEPGALPPQGKADAGYPTLGDAPGTYCQIK